MTGGALRVLAVTRNPTLVIGLTFMADGWDITSQAELDEQPDADALVLDVGSTEAALTALAAVGDERPPAVVIGDDDRAEVPDDVAVVLRPYTLADLVEQVRRLLQPDEPDLTDDVAADSDDEVSPVEASPVEASPSASAEAEGATADADQAGRGEEPADDEADEPEAAPAPAAQPGPGTVRRLATWVASLRGPNGRGTSDSPADDTAPAHAPAEDQPAVEEPVAEEPVVGEPIPDESVADEPAVEESTVGQGPELQEATDPQPSPPTRSRWIGRRPRKLEGPEQALRRRLADALTASHELERLVEELPLLRSYPALAQAVVDLVAEQLEADTTALWRAGDDGWRAVAHRGLTSHEAGLVVATTHPLFAEVDAGGGALLIDPVESAQAAVAGVGGAHTSSFMAASIAVGPGRYGILTVGRDRSLRERDLDTLVDLAVEAALGLALADWLERIVDLAAPPQPAQHTANEPVQPDDVVVRLPDQAHVES